MDFDRNRNTCLEIFIIVVSFSLCSCNNKLIKGSVNMENDPILCFQHCEHDVNILCLDLPDICPICSSDMLKTPLKIPPFRFSSPFSESKESPYSIVIKPTTGKFLRDYNNNSDLHVGITDSHGTVYDYTASGIGRHEGGWEQTLAVLTMTKHNYAVTSVWDTKLQEFCAYPQWSTQLYDEADHNCYTFGLEFLQLIHEHLDTTLPSIQDKRTFIEQAVLPHTTQAAQYISLYRNLLEQGTIVQYHTSL